ncbi:hypothetical protein H4R24_001519 [Coemansia sp. RSA 988]|nr:hypothetical protein H4R24_001519 [Coemansia sp. RSA 988]
MLRTAFARQSRLALPARATMFQSRSYVDKFQERETASENKYIHEKEKEQLRALYRKLSDARAELQRLSKHIKEKEEDIKDKAGAKAGAELKDDTESK